MYILTAWLDFHFSYFIVNTGGNVFLQNAI